MKKTRLLEIVREEIAFALREGDAEDKAAQMAALKATDLEIKALQKKKAELQKTGVAEGELEEDQLNEMAYNIVLSNPEELAKLKDKIKDSTKKGEQLLSQVIDIIQRDKKEDKPIRQRDIANELGTIQQKINPLVNLLIDYGILSKGESVTGVTKKTPSDKPKAEPKPKAEKPESTGKKGRPAGAAKEKVATRTPGADGFDDVSYSDIEKDIAGDETAKELAQASPASKDENFDRIRTGLMNKAKKAKGELSAEDKKLASQIINTAKTRYKFNATQVDALRAVAGL